MSARGVVLLGCLLLGFGFWLRSEEKPSVRLDFFGDPLPERAIARLGTTRLQHGCMMTAVAFSPDGKRLASASYTDKRTVVWEWPSGRCFHEFNTKDTTNSLRWSSDGARLAVTGSSHLRVWDARTGTEILKAEGQYGRAVFLAQGGQLAVQLERNKVQIWDLENRKELGQREAPCSFADLAVRPNGILAGLGFEDGKILLVEVESGKLLGTFATELKEPTPLAIAPNGDRFVYRVNPKKLALIDVDTKREIRCFTTEQADFVTATFTGDGATLITGHRDGFVRLWDVERVTEPRRFGPSSASYFGSLSPDGKILATGGANSPHMPFLWDASTGKPLADRFPGQSSAVHSLSLSADGKLAATASFLRGQGDIWIWETSTGKPVRMLAGHPRGTLKVSLSADGTLLASAGIFDRPIRLWDVKTGRELRTLEHPKHNPQSVVLSPDGRILAGLYWDASTGTPLPACLWDTSTGKQLSQTPLPVSTLHFQPHSNTLLLGGRDGKVHLWNPGNPSVEQTLRPAPSFGIHTLASSGQIAVILGYRQQATVWEPLTGKPIATLPESFLGVGGAVAPGDRIVAVGAASSVRLYDLALGLELSPLTGQRGAINHLWFSPDGTRLFSSAAQETSVVVYDVADLVHAKLKPSAPLAAPELKRVLENLADANPAVAYPAIWTLVRNPQPPLDLLRAALRPDPRLDEAAIGKLIRNLDAEDFETRESATTSLQIIGRAAEKQLKATLAMRISAEMQQRIEQLLVALDQPNPGMLRRMRALLVLEKLGTPEAEQILRDLAQGDEKDEITLPAKAALHRLK